MSPRGPDSSSRGGSPAFSLGSPKLYSHLEWDDEFRVPGIVALTIAASYLVVGTAYYSFITTNTRVILCCLWSSPYHRSHRNVLCSLVSTNQLCLSVTSAESPTSDSRDSHPFLIGFSEVVPSTHCLPCFEIDYDLQYTRYCQHEFSFHATPGTPRLSTLLLSES